MAIESVVKNILAMNSFSESSILRGSQKLILVED
jgi:hypothetical protein